ncbi:MAG: SMP-30/gluconolactonase/LRE family protein [Alphaproteobacteria bacterium]|nr:SMP-30/gluconolactonase/LRE family protein [Alphaproteobacteria bacterium]
MVLSVPECVLPLAAELGEGPLWWQGALWFTDIKGLKVHRFVPQSGALKSWDAPAQAGFLAPLENGHFIAGAQSGLLDFDPASGAFDPVCAVEPDQPGNRLNDGAVDAKGRLWFGSMDDGEGAASGALYRLTQAGPQAMESGIVITNGPAFSPDGRTLYHTDTLGRTIFAYDLASDGSLSNKRLFAAIEDGAGWPDGLTVDSAGSVWTGLFGGWAVRRYVPDGTLAEEIRFPVANITKIAFGGDDLRTVYATTAAKGLDRAAREGQPLAGGLFAFLAEVPGLPQRAVTVTPAGFNR